MNINDRRSRFAGNKSISMINIRCPGSRNDLPRESPKRTGNDTRSLRNMASFYDTIERDLIHDKDLVDVNNDVCLGSSDESEESLCGGPMKFEKCRDSQTIIPKGFIGDPNAEEIMIDECLNKKFTFSIKRVVVGMVGVAAILAIIAGASLTVGKDFFEKRRIKNNLKGRSTKAKMNGIETHNTELFETGG